MISIPTKSSNLRPREAAAYLGISVSTLAKLRMRHEGPAFVKVGKRIVVYRLSDLAEWLAKNRVGPLEYL